MRSRRKSSSPSLDIVPIALVYSRIEALGPVERKAGLYLSFPGNALKKNSHPRWPTSTDLASSNAEIAASLVTVVKSSMNSFRVCPPSR